MRRIFYVLAALTIIAVLTLAGFSCAASAREGQSRKAAAPGNGKFVKAGDVEIYLQEAGSGNRAPVVFIHGTGAWSETWRDSMTALASAGFRSVAIDLPPFGFSERPGNAAYSLDAQAKRIVGVLDALNIKHATLVGHSFGGGPTVEAALMATDRIRSLVLVDVALGLDAGSHDTSRIQNFLVGLTPLRNAVAAATVTNPMFTKSLLKMFIFNKAAATDARVAIYQRPFVVEGTTTAVSAWVPTLLSPPGRDEPGSEVVFETDDAGFSDLGQGRHHHSVEPGRTSETADASRGTIGAQRRGAHSSDRRSGAFQRGAPEVLEEVMGAMRHRA